MENVGVRQRGEALVGVYEREWVAKDIGKRLGHVPEGWELRVWQEVFVTKLFEVFLPRAADYLAPERDAGGELVIFNGVSMPGEIDALPARFVKMLGPKFRQNFSLRRSPGARVDMLIEALRAKYKHDGKDFGW